VTCHCHRRRVGLWKLTRNLTIANSSRSQSHNSLGYPTVKSVWSYDISFQSIPAGDRQTDGQADRRTRLICRALAQLNATKIITGLHTIHRSTIRYYRVIVHAAIVATTTSLGNQSSSQQQHHVTVWCLPNNTAEIILAKPQDAGWPTAIPSPLASRKQYLRRQWAAYSVVNSRRICATTHDVLSSRWPRWRHKMELDCYVIGDWCEPKKYHRVAVLLSVSGYCGCDRLPLGPELAAMSPRLFLCGLPAGRHLISQRFMTCSASL